MGMRTLAAAILVALIGAPSAADAAYRLCIRAGGFDSRHYPDVRLQVGSTIFTAPNGGYHNPGYAPWDSCFETDAFGPAKIGWSTPRYDCTGAVVPQENTAEVWFIVDAVLADPGFGGRMPTCTRHQ